MQNSKTTNTPKVIILCGGKGERLYPLTNDTPKPLLKIKDKPILSYIIEYLEKYNMSEIIITTGYKSNKIIDYISTNYKNSHFKIIDSGDVDIIKRLQDSFQHINGDFIVLYGDTLSNIKIDELIQYHKLSDRPVTMTVWPLTSQFGIVEVDDNGTVIGFKEKPTLNKWINIGYFYFNKEMIELINQYHSFEELLKIMADKKILNAYKHNGIHITVNTINELSEAEENINRI